jgi:O-acetylhomoserine/O-acetylserine sulfhydrylase-like pyridoxal-dependent enzyme
MNTDFQTLCASKLNVPQANPAQQLPLFLSSSFSFENLTDSIDVFEDDKPDSFIADTTILP